MYYTYKIDISSDIMIQMQKYIKKILNERGNWKEQFQNKKLDFLFVQERFSSPESYTIHSNLKNSLTSEEVSNIGFKDKLYRNIIEKYKNKPYLNKTYYHNIKTDSVARLQKHFEKQIPWIIKPVFSNSGIGIDIVNNYKELQEYFNTTKRGNRYVIQEYITNPMLFKRKKFHIRFYFMFHNQSIFLYTKNPVAFSELNYKKSDFHNKDIHDTHFRGRWDTFFPKDFKMLTKLQKDNIMTDVKKIVIDISGIVKTTCYKETKNCYQIFAMDVMITKELQIKLLECAINFTKLTKSRKDVRDDIKELIQSSFIEIVDPVFPPDNKPKDKSYFVKIK